MSFRPAIESDLDSLIQLQTDYYREDGYVHRLHAARQAWAALLADARLGRVWVNVPV